MAEHRDDALFVGLLALIAWLIHTTQSRDERIAATNATTLTDNLTMTTRAVGEAVTMAVSEATRSVLTPQVDARPVDLSVLTAYPDPYVPPMPMVPDWTDEYAPDPFDDHEQSAIVPPGANLSTFMGIVGADSA